jgi:hypothetical protein
MFELLVVLADSPIKKHIVIEPNPAFTAKTDEHTITIKYPVDDGTIKIIEPIITKYNLKITKLTDAVILL